MCVCCFFSLCVVWIMLYELFCFVIYFFSPTNFSQYDIVQRCQNFRPKANYWPLRILLRFYFVNDFCVFFFWLAALGLLVLLFHFIIVGGFLCGVFFFLFNGCIFSMNFQRGVVLRTLVQCWALFGTLIELQNSWASTEFISKSFLEMHFFLHTFNMSHMKNLKSNIEYFCDMAHREKKNHNHIKHLLDYL